MILHHALTALLLLVFPLWDRYESRWLEGREPGQSKSASYLRISAGLCLTALAAILATSFATLMNAPVTDIPRIEGLGAVLVGGLIGLTIPVVAAASNPKMRTQLLTLVSGATHLLPRTPPEFAAFALASLCAGTCEELIFRGFLLQYAMTALGLTAWPAILFSSAVFGVAHAGQGVKGILATALIGVALAWLYVASGSLVIPMILHAAIDLRALVIAALSRQSTPDSVLG